MFRLFAICRRSPTLRRCCRLRRADCYTITACFRHATLPPCHICYRYATRCLFDAALMLLRACGCRYARYYGGEHKSLRVLRDATLATWLYYDMAILLILAIAAVVISLFTLSATPLRPCCFDMICLLRVSLLRHYAYVISPDAMISPLRRSCRLIDIDCCCFSAAATLLSLPFSLFCAALVLRYAACFYCCLRCHHAIVAAVARRAILRRAAFTTSSPLCHARAMMPYDENYHYYACCCAPSAFTRDAAIIR